VKPVVLFGIQFTVSLVAFALMAWWYVAPRLSSLPREIALVPLVWVHVFRVVGGTVLAPGAVGTGVPESFQRMVGIGDLVTSVLALIALVALRARARGAIAVVWLLLVVGAADTVNAIIQSMRDNVFVHPLGVSWVIVTLYVPALIVTSILILLQLVRSHTSERGSELSPASTVLGEG